MLIKVSQTSSRIYSLFYDVCSERQDGAVLLKRSTLDLIDMLVSDFGFYSCNFFLIFKTCLFVRYPIVLLLLLRSRDFDSLFDLARK